MQNPPLGRVGNSFSGGFGCASVGAASLERFKHQIPHSADVGLDPSQPVGIALAVICALAVHAVTLGQQLPVQPDKNRVIGESAARDGGQERDEAADQRGDGGLQA